MGDSPRSVPATNFMATIAANVDNPKISDEEFREFIRNTLPIVRYTGASDGDDWQPVSFSSDCLGGEGDEPGNICSICGLDYVDECMCPGPTQDGIEYKEVNGILYGRRRRS